MAPFLAPFRNSMRLGQGFNSYTQQICLDKAVLPDPDCKPSEDEHRSSAAENKSVPTADDDDDDDDVVPVAAARWAKPQIVTYSSHFVDKLSDVTESMNISGSVSIKMAMIGGNPCGSFVDSDKFKGSDINYHLQVKVTNQIHEAKDYSKFNTTIGVHDPARLSEVYGDTFISGWEEGGELNAIISMKVFDKSKIFKVKSELEAELATGALRGDGKAASGMPKTRLSNDIETTISVNWSGGGQIKNTASEWTISTLKAVAAAFPDKVAQKPQTTYAVLTKYTALTSFRKLQGKFVPLDYENSAIYTSILTDNFMEYKAVWKQISVAMGEIEQNRASISRAELSDEVRELIKASEMKSEANTRKWSLPAPPPRPSTPDTPNSAGSGRAASVKDSFVLEEPTHVLFSPTSRGLVQAKKICRIEMTKIVKEVDFVARDPGLALDPTRDEYFMDPLIFKQLLPIVLAIGPAHAPWEAKDPNAAVILGYRQRSPSFQAPPLRILSSKQIIKFPRARESAEGLRHKGHEFNMGSNWVGALAPSPQATDFFNDLEDLDATYCPQGFQFWFSDGVLKGIKTSYTDDKHVTHGDCANGHTEGLVLAEDGSDQIIAVRFGYVWRSPYWYISYIKTCTTLGNTSECGLAPSDPTKYGSYYCPTNLPWSVRGFWGAILNSESGASGFNALGLVWGKSAFSPPKANLPMPISRSTLELPQILQEHIKIHGNKVGKFHFGKFTRCAEPESEGSVFSSLDYIKDTWRIRTISIARLDDDKALAGIRISYTNGEVVEHGKFEKERGHKKEVRTSERIVSTRILTANPADGTSHRINNIEFQMANIFSKRDSFPLSVSVAPRGSHDTFSWAEDEAPMRDVPYARWSLRGFFGATSGDVIKTLGSIWGRDEDCHIDIPFSDKTA